MGCQSQINYQSQIFIFFRELGCSMILVKLFSPKRENNLIEASKHTYVVFLSRHGENFWRLLISSVHNGAIQTHGRQAQRDLQLFTWKKEAIHMEFNLFGAFGFISLRVIGKAHNAKWDCKWSLRFTDLLINPN